MESQRKLVKECLQNNAVAQKQLYELYSADMLGVCYRYTKSLNDAQEVLQQGFIKVFLNLHQYNLQGELGHWIRRIMVNTSINYLKRTPRYQMELGFEDNHLHPVSTDEPGRDLDLKYLLNMIRQLPPGYQTIFNLHAIEGYTHVE